MLLKSLKRKTSFTDLRKTPLIKVGLSASIFAVCFIISTFSDLRLWIPELVLLTAVLTLLSVLAVYAAEKRWCRWSPAFILAFAGVLRIMLLFRNPELSDDLFRYVFDGLMLLDGINPYASPPVTATQANPHAAALIPFINHGHLVTIYPPAAQLLFASGAFAGGIIGMKSIFILMDMAACVLILGILRRIGLPDTRLILYAWHPLPLIEIAASGHIDGAAVCLMLLAIYFCLGIQKPGTFSKGKATAFFRPHTSGMVFLAGVCFAGAVLVKWIPLLFLPGIIFLVPFGKRRFWFFGFSLTGMMLFIPFWPDIKSSFVTLSIYMADWEFAGFAFRSLRRITGSGNTSRSILAVCGMLSVGVIYTHMYLRAFIKKSILLCRSPSDYDRSLDILRAFYAAAMAWLVMTPTLHPWYGLYLVFLLPFSGGPAGVVFSWAFFLSYQVLILYHLTGQWVENDWAPLLIIAAPFSAAVIYAFRYAFLCAKKH